MLFARSILITAFVVCVFPLHAQTLPTTDLSQLKGPRGIMGYLQPKEVIDGVAVIPPPPKPGSAAQAADDEVYKAAIAAIDSPRWKQAIADSEERNIGKALQAYACALGTPITPRTMPHTFMLVVRTISDIGVAYDKGKDYYGRLRPYAALNGPNCQGYGEAEAKRSYPSGHAAVGWGISLVLTEVAPDRATELIRRGREFSESRAACGVHWMSDVVAGRDIGAAVVAQLHSNDDFRAQLAEARKEVAAARATAPLPEGGQCAAEAAALGR